MDYYCSTKFTDLQVHVQSRLLYNCCRAYPERADLDWLEDNPGKIFHTKTMTADRELMLKNNSCHSCHHGCYKYEEQGLTSARKVAKAKDRIDKPPSQLKTLQISLSTDCNLTCMYCSPQFSTAWYRDIEKNGKYVLEGQSLENDNWSDLWSKLKQKQRSTSSRFFNIILNEIKLAEGLEKVVILGGEPLLNNQLLQVIDAVHCNNIIVTTGLGVSADRLYTVLGEIKHNKNITFDVSAEATGKFFEFTRHGMTWSDFQQRTKMITDRGYRVSFISTLSNVSVLDFHNFVELYKDHTIKINPITDRRFLMPHVLDEHSKQSCVENLGNISTHFQAIKDMLHNAPSSVEQNNAGNYIKQFASRRNIDLGFLPKHLLDWLGIS